LGTKIKSYPKLQRKYLSALSRYQTDLEYRDVSSY
jgi:hypothetical protein